MARSKTSDTGTVELPVLGEEGEACAECGSALATDQRYCLNCGARRGAPRTDFSNKLVANGSRPQTLNGTAAVAPAMREWSPITVIGSIAVLGVMLLLGVLIGKDDNKTTQPAAAPATTAATTPTTPTTAATTTPTAKKGAKGAKGGAPAATPAGPAVKGGSGDTSGVPTAQTNLGTGKDYEEAQKHTPDVQATQGAPAQQDPNGKPGGGSGATVIK